MTPKVAFVIICWNNEELLKDCLESIGGQSYKNYRTIMVDNGSRDDSVATAKKVLPSIDVIEKGHNNGFAKGNNIGIKYALEDPDVKYIALLNTDARLDKAWLESIIRFAANKPNAAGLQGSTLDYNRPEIIDSTHLYVNRRGQAAQGNWQNYFYRDEGPKKVFGVNAAACVFTRKFIGSQPYHNFFDETMFMYLEDVDVATRATIMGWDNYLVPGAVAYHMGSTSSGGKVGFSNYGIYMTFRNNLGVLIKNFPWLIVFKIIIKMPRADFQTRKHLIKTGHKEAANKVLKGRLVSILRMPIYLWQRRKLITKRSIDKDYLWALMKNGY